MLGDGGTTKAVAEFPPAFADGGFVSSSGGPLSLLSEGGKRAATSSVNSAVIRISSSPISCSFLESSADDIGGGKVVILPPPPLPSGPCGILWAIFEVSVATLSI